MEKVLITFGVIVTGGVTILSILSLFPEYWVHILIGTIILCTISLALEEEW